MTYTPEIDPLALVLDLGVQYSPVLDPLAQDFDLAESGGVVYRKPPLAVSVGYLSAQASVMATDIRKQMHELGRPEDGAGRRHRSQQAHILNLYGYADGWNDAPSRDAMGRQFSGEDAFPLDLRAEQILWSKVPERDDPTGFGQQAWDIQPAKDSESVHGFNVPPAHDLTDQHRASDSILNWQPPPPQRIDLVQTEILNLQIAPYSPPGALVVDFELVPDALVVEVTPPTRSVDALPAAPGWSLKEALDGRTIHPWDRKPRLNTEVDFPSASEPYDPSVEPPDEPETKRTYIVMNASSLIEVTTGTPLEFQDLSISLDADSFAWTMTCTILNRASMDQIRPTSEGPAEVIATVNGHQWRLVIESYSISRQFPKETYQVKGVSRSQLLAAPYAPVTTGRIASQTTATQVMTGQLQYTGFSVSRQQGLTDYVIPADAWGWDQKTAMEVIAELAAAQGAIVVPDMDADVLNIKHRYKLVGPWDYPDQPIEFLDAIVQDTMVISYSSQWEPNQEYNAVFVSGITAGVAVDVVRQGTAGDQAADDIFDDLNVEAYQCRERGLAAIAAGGNQEIVTIETVLPTSGSPGLIEPGMVIEYRDTQDLGNSWRGNVLSTGISVSNPGTGRVTQTIKVERHHYGNS